jgi:hypothetical protein
MKPLVYSEKNARYKNVGWHRDGSDICYYTTNMKRKNGGYYSSLAFTIKFERTLHNYFQMISIQSTLLIAILTPTPSYRNSSKQLNQIRTKRTASPENFSVQPKLEISMIFFIQL